MRHSLLMRWTCLLISLLLFTLLPARAGHSAPKIFLRIHVQTTGEGQSQLETAEIMLPPNNEKILIRALPEITEQELVNVQADAAGAVHLQFNHQGQVALSTVTAENQGRILVVIINGYVVFAPVIDEQITNGELILPHQVNPQMVQLLQDVAQHNVREAAKT
jgi:preprotein translocase subunit SecD